jgi:hypothetical protein
MVEIIPDEATFKKLLPGFPVPTDRKFSAKYGIVRAGDNILVRVKEQRITFDPAF